MTATAQDGKYSLIRRDASRRRDSLMAASVASMRISGTLHTAQMPEQEGHLAARLRHFTNRSNSSGGASSPFIGKCDASPRTVIQVSGGRPPSRPDSVVARCMPKMRAASRRSDRPQDSEADIQQRSSPSVASGTSERRATTRRSPVRQLSTLSSSAREASGKFRGRAGGSGTWTQRVSRQKSLPASNRTVQGAAGSPRPKSEQRRRQSAPAPQMDVKGQPNTTSVAYWDSVALTWQGEIQDSLREDRGRAVYRALDEFVTGVSTVVDLGCGVGNYIPDLAFRAEHVIGVDISPACIDVARELCRKFRINNCSLHVADLGHCNDIPEWLPGPVPVAVCMNVVISPDSVTREEILSLAWRSLQPAADESSPQSSKRSADSAPSKQPEAADAADPAPALKSHVARTRRTPQASVSGASGESRLGAPGGGILLLVVPAVESVILVRERRQELARGRKAKKPPRQHNPEDDDLGIFRREGVRTKHFTAAELTQVMEESGFVVLRFERVIYDWDSEIPGAGWLGEPRPFDWLVICQRSDSICNLHDDDTDGIVQRNGNAEEGDACAPSC